MKKITYCLLAITIIISLSGCQINKGQNIELKKGKFYIVCNSNDSDDTIKRKIESTYNFNGDEYVINYKVVTTQKFEDKSTYETYKKAQEETLKNNNQENIKYDLQKDDNTKTLVFTMAITSIDTSASATEEKEKLKAISILNNIKKNKEAKPTCKIYGITKEQLEK